MSHLLASIINPAIKPEVGGGPVQAYVSGGDFTFVLVQYLGVFMRLAFITGSVVFLAMLILGSIEYITAGGEKEKAGNAAKRITNAIIGIAVLFSVFAVLALLKLIFGIDILQLKVPVIT